MKKLFTLFIALVLMVLGVQAQIKSVKFTATINGEQETHEIPATGFRTVDLTDAKTTSFVINSVEVETESPLTEVLLFATAYKDGRTPEPGQWGTIPLSSQGNGKWAVELNIELVEDDWLTDPRKMVFELYLQAKDQYDNTINFDNGGEHYKILFATGDNVQSDKIKFYGNNPALITMSINGEQRQYIFSADGSYMPSDQPGELESLVIDRFEAEIVPQNASIKDEGGYTLQYKVQEEGADAQWNTLPMDNTIIDTYYTIDDGIVTKHLFYSGRSSFDIASGLQPGKNYSLKVMFQVVTDDNEYYMFPYSKDRANFNFSIPEEVGPEPLRGDINRDNQVNTTDVTTLYNVIFGTDVTTDRALCDLNNDGEINTTDVTELYNIIFGTATAPEDNNEFNVNGVTFKMVKVDGGTFQMGSTSGDSDEQPVHSVTLSDYYIGETEVTQALWEAVMGSNPSGYSGNQRPVENVNWEDCQTFITKLNQLTGRKFRLPTEAEWEFAARGGTQSNGYTYSGSNTVGDVAWYGENSSGQTHDVATKAPNELGIYDMSGNVLEWCQDGFKEYSSNPQTNPTGSDQNNNRVYRGGCFGSEASVCRVSFRSRFYSTIALNILGLRLAL